MSHFDEVEKKHLALYGSDPEYTAEFDAKQIEYAEQGKRLFEQQLSASIKAGRYTLGQAADYIARNANADREGALKLLTESVTNGTLITYAPGLNNPYRGRVVRDFYEEVFWDDLNAWLVRNRFRLGWSFPDPGISETTAKPKPETATGGANAKTESARTRLKSIAREIGEQWMKAERKDGRDPGGNEIAQHVEAELKKRDERGPRGDYWDWQTIKKEALKGITGRLPNGKRQKS
jgi:hypothetical protein